MSKEENDLIQDLQMRIAFLEQNLDEMNKVMTDQQAQVSLLERALKHVNTRLEQVDAGGIKNPDDEVPPPHY